MIAGWCKHQVMAPMTFNGYCNSGLVEAWVQEFLGASQALPPQDVESI
jgi:hypothetical protein